MIYTFYSYKGGVGRSMALSNIAECFYLQGLRVRMVDWDLEAPGLEAFFDEGGPADDAQARERPGLIDLLGDYKHAFAAIDALQGLASETELPDAFRTQLGELAGGADPDDFEAALDSRLRPLSQYLHLVHGRSDDPQAPSLSLLRAGMGHSDGFRAYARAVQEFDWEEFYGAYRGKEFIDWLMARLQADVDVVLIDSRTGVTEMGGVCARQMADVVVSFSAPNKQNIDGVERMVGSFQRAETQAARGARELKILIVPSRIDPQEVDDLRIFETRFRGVVDQKGFSPDEFRALGLHAWHLQIPYRAKYAYHERRVIGPNVPSLDPTRGLEEAYWKLAEHLALLASEDHPLRVAFRDRLLKSFPQLAKPVLCYMPDGVDMATELRNALGPLTRDWAELRHDDTDTDPSARIVQAGALIAVLSPRALADDGPLRRELRLARQLGIHAHGVVPAQGIAPPFWLQWVPLHVMPAPSLARGLATGGPVLRAPVMAPEPPLDAVERSAELARLKQVLLAAAAAAGRTTLALCGVGGAGKTGLLAIACRDEDVIDSFPAGIFFVNASEHGNAQRILGAITGEGAPAGLPPARARELLRGRRALLVVDDVWSDARFAELASLVDTGAVVAVTRDVRLARSLAREPIELGELTREEAGRLLPEASLPERFGRLPLVVALARNWLRQNASVPGADADALMQKRIEREGLLAFDRRDAGLPFPAPGSAKPESASDIDLSAPARNASLARSIEFSLAQLRGWQRRRFEQAAVACAQDSANWDQIRKAWHAFPPDAGEPRFLEDEKAGEALCERLSDLALMRWDPVGRTLALPAAIRDYLEAQGVLGQHDEHASRRRAGGGAERFVEADVTRAIEVVAGSALRYDELVALAQRLKKQRYFSYARRLFALARTSGEAAPHARLLAQQQALCTYKDPDLPTDQRCDLALAILATVENLATTHDQETLGLAGAIHKQRWANDGQRAGLELSLAYYLRGEALGSEGDYGYNAINAAFVLDLIALQELQEAGTPDQEPASVKQRRSQARGIRERIVERLALMPEEPSSSWTGHTWWFVVTVAEALFGLGRHEPARQWLRDALALEFDEWEFQATAQQLTRLALAQNDGRIPGTETPAFRTLRVFLGEDLVALQSVAVGKVGLALSGGGYRASLYHIGVLARLAELDMLRHVEVLSCVSGGSIVGAHYYLEVKALLESKTDAEIGCQDYVDLVGRIETDFLAGVQKNARTRLLANPLPNLRSLVSPRYTRTDRLGELFEQMFYAKCAGHHPIYMDELLIQPKPAGAEPNAAFVPKLDNWRRAAKVPILVLNATALNTGHNWQFTASWMGEPPSSIGTEVDGNERLRRLYYFQAPPAHRRVRLGMAVAASACVPGLFDPVDLRGLYPQRSVRLVDGGVRDNQGVGGLLDQECSVLLVSDASGQMSAVSEPAAGVLGVAGRVTSVQGARVREAQFVDLEARRRSSLIRGLGFIHLKKDLDSDPVDWVDCMDPAGRTAPVPLTSYGVLKTIQRQLAAIRTDLDSFNDVEACALMLSGYRMASLEFKSVLPAQTSPSGRGTWRFQEVAPGLDRAPGLDQAHRWLGKLLAVGERRFMKVWHLSPALLASGLLSAGAIIVALLVWARNYERARSLLADAAAWGVIGLELLAGVPVLLWIGYRALGVRKPFGQLLTGFAFGTVGWVLPWLHLRVFDPGYLALGRMPPGGLARPAPAGAALWRPSLVVAAIVALLVGGYQWVLHEAMDAQQRSDYAAALPRWNLVIAVHPGGQAYLARAVANAALDNFGQALADFDRALAGDADRPEVYRQRAMTYETMGNPAATIADIDRLSPAETNDTLRRVRESAVAKLAAVTPPSAIAASAPTRPSSTPAPASSPAASSATPAALPLADVAVEIFACPGPAADAAARGANEAIRRLGARRVSADSVTWETANRAFDAQTAHFQVRYLSPNKGSQRHEDAKAPSPDAVLASKHVAAANVLLADAAFRQLASWTLWPVNDVHLDKGATVIRLVLCPGAGKAAVPSAPAAST